MKTQLLRFALFFVGFALVASAMAQSRPGNVRAQIPFSFHVGNRQLPAGSYIVAPATDGLLHIFNTKDSHSQMFTPVFHVQSPVSQTPKLVFHRYGTSYFLTAVWNSNGEIGRELPRSKAEDEIASGKVTGSRLNREVAEVRANQ
jgi:hypothetical protein